MELPPTFPYDVCRMYVTDVSSKLGEQATKRILGWIRSRDLPHLASATEHFPELLIEREARRVLMQVEAFFKKNASFSDPVRCETAALDSFESSERRCRITNKRLDWYFSKPGRLDPDLRKLISRACWIIEDLLGPFEQFLDSLPKNLRFTSGATATTSRRSSQPFRKVSKKPYCTAGAAAYLRALSHYFGYGDLSPRLISFNRVEQVPKNWKTNRMIACEPSGNVPLQLAFDSFCKEQLKKWRIDLSDQSRNQRMALEGSVNDELVTVDLEAASDTVSFNTVAWLLPEPYFEFLNAVRSTHWKDSDGLHKYAKFSSMGNGATFVIETLIFAALARASGDHNAAVYGDDIVIRRSSFSLFEKALGFFGFVVNSKKTHLAGPFRESCGVNYFSGCDITPFYLRETPKAKWSLCHVVNGLASVALPGGTLWNALLEIVVSWKLPLVPLNTSTISGVFVTPDFAWSKKLVRTNLPRFRQQPMIRSYVPKQKTEACSDLRGLFLWHHRALRRNTDIVITKVRPFKSSGTPASSVKYGRKWVHWDVVPVAAAPAHHLWWWAEDLARKLPS